MTRPTRPWCPPAVLLAVCCLCMTAAEAQPKFSKPDRIRYDGSCLTVEGRDMMVFSGAFHYFRCPPELWRDRFRKIKEAGCNTVETYVAWNFHERDMPASLDDYSKINLDQLAAWMKMAHEEFGLYTIIRPGPYICAEWAGGGYPRWLMLKKPASFQGPWLRSDEANYLAWCSHFMKAVTAVVAPEQITNKPVGAKGVILFQIENEYDYARDFSNDTRINQLKSLYNDSVAGGIDVPIFSCVTKQSRGSSDEILKNVFDASNNYPRRNLNSIINAVRDLKKKQPNAPAMIAELQGGWFSTIGGSLSEDQPGIDAIQVSGVTLAAMQEGATILNYYMLFGGTNFGDDGSRTMLTSYDYGSPIREHGGVGDKFLAVKAIGKMINEFGPRLSRSVAITLTVDDAPKDITFGARKLTDESQMIFVRNASSEKREGTTPLRLGDAAAISVNFELAPYEMRVLHVPPGASPAQGRWLPEQQNAIERPAVPASIRLTTAMRKSEPAPIDLVPFHGKSMVELGENHSPTTVYRCDVTLTELQASRLTQLWVKLYQENPVALRVNGQTIPAQSATGKLESDFNLAGKLKTGANQIELIHMALGYPNFGAGIDHVAGFASARLLPLETQTRPIETWRIKAGTQSDLRKLVADDANDADWQAVVLNELTLEEIIRARQPGAPAAKHPALTFMNDKNIHGLYRTRVTLTADEIAAGKTLLRFGRIDDSSTIFINGKEAGQSSDWNTPVKINGAEFLKPGDNLISVLVHNIEGEGGLTRPVSLVTIPKDGLSLDWKMSPTLVGVRDKWYANDTSPEGWSRIELDPRDPIPDRGARVPTGVDGAPVEWYRMEFALPVPNPNVWVPWHVRIAAAGQGEIYLNGRHLGRWFEPGPQRQYYLPEAWLNFGPGAKNVVTLALIPITKGTGIAAAEVLPAADFAESRP